MEDISLYARLPAPCQFALHFREPNCSLSKGTCKQKKLKYNQLNIHILSACACDAAWDIWGLLRILKSSFKSRPDLLQYNSQQTLYIYMKINMCLCTCCLGYKCPSLDFAHTWCKSDASSDFCLLCPTGA